MNYIMRKENINNVQKDKYTDNKEASVMPSIELIESERLAYIKGMEDYLHQLKQMNKNDAQKKSHESLVRSRIIQENGEYTEHYEYTKIVLQNKR